MKAEWGTRFGMGTTLKAPPRQMKAEWGTRFGMGTTLKPHPAK